MSTSISRISGMTLSLEARRARTTPVPANTFKTVLATGAQVLLAGASAASGLVGGPLLSGAIDAARGRLAMASGQGFPGGGTADPLLGTAPVGTGANTGSPPSALGVVSGDVAAGGEGGTSELDAMRQLQREGQQHNLQYLQLQKEAQDDNRRFNVASNLLKARHDTARSAVNNMRV